MSLPKSGRALLFLSLFIASLRLGAAPRPEREKTLPDYWREVGLSPALLERRVGTPRCYADLKEFQACVEGLNGALSALPAPLALDPAAPAKPSPLGADPAGLEPPVLRKLRQERLAAWESVFRQGPGKVDFAGLWRGLRRQVPPETESAVVAAGLNAYLAATHDPHTQLVPSSFLRDEQKKVSRRFSGIGVSLQRTPAGIILSEVLEDGPGAQAGLLVGDVLVQIEGQAVLPLATLDETSRRLEGPEGSALGLQIRRRATTLFLRPVRKLIIRRPVVARAAARDGRKWGVLRMRDLSNERACDSLREAMTGLLNGGAKALVLDLRDNPGGLVSQAVCVANLFLPPGKKVVSLRELSSAREVQQWTTSEPAITAVPLVVLINAGSASAAEIVAGALQDHGRASLVGVRSFGKGSLQDTSRWPEAKGVEYLTTVARSVRPSGQLIQLVGIIPEWVAGLQPSANPSEDEQTVPREEDRHPNALPGDIGPRVAPAPPTPALRACVKSVGQADKRYETAGGGDYPLFVAEDVLYCALESNPT